MRGALIGLLLIFLAACQSLSPPTEISKENGKEIIVFAAASLTDVVDEISQIFQEQNPDVRIIHNYAGSQQLAHQLAQGAPADVFLSANQVQAYAVMNAGRARQEEIIPFTGNNLAIVAPAKKNIKVMNFNDLEKPGIKLVVASPDVPAGKYFIEVLDKAGREENLGVEFQQRVTENIVSYEENVRSVLSKVILGEADAGIVYYSDALLAGPDQVRLIDIPNVFNIQTTYYLVPIDNGAKIDPVKRYIQLILSDEIQPVFSNFGLLNTR